MTNKTFFRSLFSLRVLVRARTLRPPTQACATSAPTRDPETASCDISHSV